MVCAWTRTGASTEGVRATIETIVLTLPFRLGQVNVYRLTGRASVDRLRLLDIRTVHPGHGTPASFLDLALPEDACLRHCRARRNTRSTEEKRSRSWMRAGSHWG
jgi:hypothetical protein